MRICIVSALPPLPSAIPAYTLGLVEGLSKSNPEDKFYVLANKDAKTVDFLPKNVEVVRVWNQDPRFVFQVLKSVIRIRPDVVHVQHEFALYGGPVPAMLFPMLLGLLRIQQIKTALTLHGVIAPGMVDKSFRDNFFVKGDTPVLKVGLFLTTLFSSHLANLMIVHAEWQRRLLENSFGVTRPKTTVIPHGTKLFPRQTLADESASKSIKVVFFGYVTPSKGLEVLLRAFADIPQSAVELTIMGGKHRRDRYYYDSIVTQVDRIRDKKVQLTGYLEDSKVHEILSGADLAVFPYLTGISVSGALCAAIGHCLPILATATPSFSEYLSPDVNCVMVRPGDAAALAEALDSLLDDHDFRMRLERGVRELAEKIAWENIGKQTKLAYRNILEGRPIASGDPYAPTILNISPSCYRSH